MPHLNEFRKEPAILKFDKSFTPNHKSSPTFVTVVSSVFHLPFIISVNLFMISSLDFGSNLIN